MRNVKALGQEMGKVRCGHCILRFNITRYNKRTCPKRYELKSVVNTTRKPPMANEINSAW